MERSSVTKLLFSIFFLVSYVEAKKCFCLKDLPGGLPSESGTLVKTKTGWLQGKYVQQDGKSFYSFKGIPYAEPPVGNLRFQAPKPKESWSGVLPALEHGDYCANREGWFGVPSLAGGSEDCLFLNVYTPSTKGKRPVMFWIHGGSLVSGNGNDIIYGPDHIVDKDVVLVTINYRLGAFGFLSTGDQYAPGNQGLKDQRLALRWVHENIKKFGGDPKQLTIFGESAGAASTHYLTLSDSTQDLFQQVILMSGNSLIDGLFQQNPRPQAENFASNLNLNFSNSQELVTALQAVNFEDINNNQLSLFAMNAPWGLVPFEFVPTIEPEGTPDSIITQTPHDLMTAGKFPKVPLMLGSTSFEGLFIAVVFTVVSGLLDFLNTNPNYIVPNSYELDAGSSELPRVVQELQNLYFNGNTEGNLLEWLKVYGDRAFGFTTDRIARFQISNGNEQVYYYNFDFDGSLNFFKKNFSLQSFEGVTHGDELLYLFEPGAGIEGFEPDEQSSLVREKMSTLWTNFAKYGNPTPEVNSLIEEIWTPYTIDGEEYFNIGRDGSLSNLQYLPRMKFLSDLQVELSGHY